MKKILHRIYFGFDGKPDPYGNYLETWKKELPDYQIMYWNAKNLPIDNCFFSKKMFELKDHAFLSDYYRWWILNNYGGVYFDADIEVVNGTIFNSIFEEVSDSEDLDGAIGIDKKKEGWYTAHSMIMKPHSAITEFMCRVYEDMGDIAIWRRKIFYFMAPQLTSLYFCSYGHNVAAMGTTPNLETPLIVNRIKIYPQDFFSPLSPEGGNAFVIDAATKNTCICHHFSCSWHDADSVYKKKAAQNAPLLNDLLEIYRVKSKPSKSQRGKVRRYFSNLIRAIKGKAYK